MVYTQTIHPRKYTPTVNERSHNKYTQKNHRPFSYMYLNTGVHTLKNRGVHTSVTYICNHIVIKDIEL